MAVNIPKYASINGAKMMLISEFKYWIFAGEWGYSFYIKDDKLYEWGTNKEIIPIEITQKEFDDENDYHRYKGWGSQEALDYAMKYL